MKTRINPFLALLSGSLVLSGSLSAAALYWDGGTTTQTANNAVDGGAGYWQNGLVNWTNVGGDTESAWANGPGNDAVFSGTAARVALNSVITVGNINFATPGYTIDLSRDLNATTSGQPVYNLTASSLSGSSGTIQASSTWNTGTFTLDTPVSTTSTWSGTIGNVGSKMGFTKQGAGTFEYSGTLKTEFGNNVNINGGTMKFVGAVNSSNNVFWNVNNSGTTLDLNGNTINGFRNLNTGTGTTLTSAGAVTQSWTYANTGSTLNGDITGAVKLSFNVAGLTIGLGGNSTYMGGTTIAPNWKEAVNINVTSNTGMGAGPVFLDGFNSGANSSTINVNFRTAAPVIGSLANDGEGLANNVVLGNTGVNTTLTVGALGTNTEFKGVIKDFTGQVGGLTKTGTGTLTLGGANTYTGATVIKNGTLALNTSNDRLPTGTTVTLGDGTTNDSGILKLDSRSQQLAGLLTAGTGTANKVVNGNGTAATLTVNIASGTNSFGGVLGGTGGNENNFAVTKTGDGTLTLGGTNTYTGATTVSSGTLLINGSLGNTTTTVNGGTLGGTGTIGGAVTIGAGAFLSPGASIESLGVASADINGTLITEYDGTGAGSIDLLAVTGLLDIVGATVDFNLFGTALDDPYYIFATYGSLTGTFGTVSDLPTGYEIQYAYNNGITATNIALVAIPEPNAAALLGGLGTLLLLRRRR